MKNIIERYGQEIDLSKEGKTACPQCRSDGGDKSGNNLHVYGLDKGGEHGGCYCFACDFSFPSVQRMRENGYQEYDYEKENIVGMEFNDEVLAQIKNEYEFITDEVYRGIRPDIYKLYAVMHKYDENGDLSEQIYPAFKGSDLVGFKRRGLPKTFLTPYGETGIDVDLFGQFRFLKSQSRDVLIVGGEIDAMSAFQMLKDYRDRQNAQKGQDFAYTPVVSGTVGENSTAKQAQKQYEWLNRFERIIICMDNDKAGKKALEQIAQSVPKNKLFVMEMSYKDPNDYLKNGKDKEFISDFFKCHPYVPVGVKGSSTLMDDIRKNALIEKIPLPPYMHKLQKMMAGGIPLGVIVNLISSSGTGKSTHVEEIIYHWLFNSPYLCGILSLESDSGEYGTKLLSRHVGRKINLIESVDEKLAFLDSEYVQNKSKELFFRPDGMDRFILMDERDGNVDDVKDIVEKMIIECGCQVIVTDPLQDLIACLPDDEQNKFMSWQKGLVKSHRVTFFNVNHTKKALNGGGSGSQGSDLSEEDTHGTSAIYKSGAANLLFSRNKEAENPVVRNTTMMKMSKCRWTGNTSPFAGKYYYDNETHTVHDFDDYWKDKVLPQNDF